ncbi:hypothetical protein MAR_008676 [Mya arenaria]|uniref:Uncharacterized protein n=1 Tax=Mya arenaria TaxID=6604 RepID=A0ABY7DWL2_MYAAR|nr:hypothetical protein MAR_008676 [Mya arenaria]
MSSYTNMVPRQTHIELYNLTFEKGNFGVYTKWVQENFSPDSSGVTKYETLINNAEAQGVINRNEALEVYTKSMMGEVNFFDSIKTM